MKQKRYAIVRVGKDGNCLEEFICKGDCNNCDYGDTKEQLIRKVAQVIRRYRKNLEVCDYCDMKDEFEIAKEIVEFLGVK